VSVEMVSKKGCKEMLGEDLPWDENAMVCAGGRTTDACQVSLLTLIGCQFHQTFTPSFYA